jgi:hypothetical protein
MKFCVCLQEDEAVGEHSTFMVAYSGLTRNCGSYYIIRQSMERCNIQVSNCTGVIMK